jgi:hypothetical protein
MKIADADVCCFIGAGSGIVQEQQERVVATPLRGATVGCREQGIHLRLVEVGNWSLSGSFEGNRPKLSAPFDTLGTTLADEMGQHMDHGQSLVARRHAAAARLLQALKELSHTFSADVIEVELINRFMDFAGDEGDKEGQRIAVAALRVACQVAFAHQMLKEKAPDPGAELRRVTHGTPPERRTARSAAMLPAATPASSSGRLEWQRY